jgi:hypothetical protein
MAAEPSVPTLFGLLRDGRARVPATWELDGPARAGLWWRVPGSGEVVATPALMRLAASLPADGEAVGALLATEPRYRDPWLTLEAARLRDLGQRGALPALCEAIGLAGPAAGALRERLATARLAPTGQGALELAIFGGAADQPMAALPLRRALAATAPRVEGDLGAEQAPLPPTDPEDPAVSWRPGRLLQAPDTDDRSDPDTAGDSVLSGRVAPCEGDPLRWVLDTPWATLLAVLGFTAEAWAAERRGGVQLELPLAAVQSFGAPPRIDVVVTLPDGREVLCGSLGELCLHAVDALGMALVPPWEPADLDAALGPVVARLLRAGVWVWQPDARPRYVISDAFSRACYGGLGHRAVYLNGERLAEVLRAVCVTWARARAGLLDTASAVSLGGAA